MRNETYDEFKARDKRILESLLPELYEHTREFMTRDRVSTQDARDLAVHIANFKIGHKLMVHLGCYTVNDLIRLRTRYTNEQLKHLASVAGIGKMYPDKMEAVIVALGGKIKRKRIGRRTQEERDQASFGINFNK